MKKIRIFAGIGILLISQLSFSQVSKKIVVEHFTNTKCSICASRNPGFYSNLSNQPGAIHLAVHPSAPYSSCLLYQQNATANDERTNYYGVYGGTPRLVINGDVIPTSANYASSAIFTPYQTLTSPASIRIVQEKNGADSIFAKVIIKTEASHSLGSLSLFVALAEDTIFYNGGNGETEHYDVFRQSLSNTSGMIVNLPATIGDSLVYEFSAKANSVWDYNRIYTLAILQETTSKSVVQAEAAMPDSGSGTLRIYNVSSPIAVKIFPNPTSNFLSIESDEIIDATVILQSLDGKIMHQEFVTKSELRIDISTFPKAVYLLKIASPKGEFSGKIFKL